MANLESVRDEMIRESEEFRELNQQHQALEGRLEALQQKSMPSEQDEIEMKQIKHDKLRLKDRMMALAREREAAQATA